MPLTREERKLLHQKSKQPTFGVNKPDAKEGYDGDIAFRQVSGSGTVQYVKENGDWTAIASSGKMPKSRNIITSSSSRTGIIDHSDLAGLGNDDHVQYLLISGTRAMTGNLDMGTNNIGSVGTLDVDGHTTLDQVTINTADGAFAVSGANNISLTTTGTNDIVLTSAQDLDFNVSGTCDWNTAITDWDNSGTFTLTSLDDTIIETQGTTSSPKTLSLIGGKSDFTKYGLISITNYNKISESGDATTNFSSNGIHIKTDAGNVSAKHNNILIEQSNQHSKGSAYGINLKSANGIKIESGNNNATENTSIIVQATGTIDIGLGTSITPNTNQARIKIHGVSEVETLYRPASDGTTHTNTHYPIDTSTHSVKFDQIDTFKLLRATTYLTSATVTRGNPHTIVSAANDDNITGTCWLVTVTWKHAANDVNSQLWMCTAVGSTDNTLIAILVKENLESTHGTASASLTWTESAGIVWTNNHSAHSSSDAIIKASALRIQSGNDF